MPLLRGRSARHHRASDPAELTQEHPRSGGGLHRLRASIRNATSCSTRAQVSGACRACLDLQLHRADRLAEPHDAVQGEGGQEPRGRLGRALRLSRAAWPPTFCSIRRRMCRSAKTRSSIWSLPATSRRNSTTTSPRLARRLRGFLPAARAAHHRCRDARDELARRHQENVEVGRERHDAHQPHRRCRRDRQEDQEGQDRSRTAAVGAEGIGGRPEADNLVGIYAALAETTKEKVLREFGGAQFSKFKDALAELATDKLTPIGDRDAAAAGRPASHRPHPRGRRGPRPRHRRSDPGQDQRDRRLHPLARNDKTAAPWQHGGMATKTNQSAEKAKAKTKEPDASRRSGSESVSSSPRAISANSSSSSTRRRNAKARWPLPPAAPSAPRPARAALCRRARRRVPALARRRGGRARGRSQQGEGRVPPVRPQAQGHGPGRHRARGDRPRGDQGGRDHQDHRGGRGYRRARARRLKGPVRPGPARLLARRRQARRHLPVPITVVPGHLSIEEILELA